MAVALDDLLLEAHDVCDRFWFVQVMDTAERTDATVTLRFAIAPDLFVQVFFSQSSQRLSFALVGPSGRLYGCDRERGRWHRHPFGQSDRHEPLPAGMATLSLMQFMAEVEVLLVEHDLI